ncbi:Myb-related transcription factor, partner of profilin-like [Oopsacas minuta]|uniref:Myb-related transcription factor, partner of profilin-like n=1 Tax=Oopsacas minuta TaxID=111878 RepID=A0AAV7KJP4_9METZ|nr:Myb-related transcription factor, partner of profilin-like [Oopsacas minuta]
MLYSSRHCTLTKKKVSYQDNWKERPKQRGDNVTLYLIHDQKSELFGALTSTLTFDDKNKIWEEISGRLSELHGNVRTRDDIMKKWYNILSKHKPRIANKLASARKTGGGPADADLNEIEAKIRSIKGKEAFECIESGIDLSLEFQCSNDETERMLMSPAVPSEDMKK